MDIHTFLSGLGLGLSLIAAIGAQNAFILKQALKKEYIFTICLICSLSDALLISLGVGGFSAVVKSIPWLDPVARYGGAAFLIFYGTNSFISAFKKTHALIPEGGKVASSYKVVILTCLTFTWLNPHVYLDTIVFMGTISTQFEGHHLEFALGAISASFIFFFAVGYGARLLIPIFKNPRSWKILEFLIGILMYAIALKILLD